MKKKRMDLLACVIAFALTILPGCQRHNHLYGEWVVTTEATCTAEGVETRTCECGNTQSQAIPRTEHSYGDWSITSAATCAAEGVETRTCECGNIQSQAIPRTEHSYGDWSTKTAATCTTEGVEIRTCECGNTQSQAIPRAEHSYGDWSTKTAATCTTEGVKTRACKCGDTQSQAIPRTEHSYGDWSTKTAATCITDGNQTRTCKCGDTQTQSISATGHSYGNWSITTAATCTTDGNQTRTCKCGDTQTQSISATGHNWKNATCTDAKTCANCSGTSGSALGHSKDSNGYCTRCNQKLTIDMNTVVGPPDECASTEYFGFCFYKNSVDGIKVCWGGQNLSGKTVNYYSVTIYFYNAVGDPAYSEITGKSSKTIRYVGPVAPNEDLLVFSVVDYVPVCSKIVIGEITLEYADGTSDTGWYGWSTTYINSTIK